MKLENEFVVPAPVERAWEVMLDIERIAPCLPGASVEKANGGKYEGTMTVKLGPIVNRYNGTLEIQESDESARRAVLSAKAREARGQGTAAATITSTMETVDDGTRVKVETDIRITGPAAQFGRGVMQDVSAKLMRDFADCLAQRMSEPDGATDGKASPEAAEAAAKAGKGKARAGKSAATKAKAGAAESPEGTTSAAGGEGSSAAGEASRGPSEGATEGTSKGDSEGAAEGTSSGAAKGVAGKETSEGASSGAAKGVAGKETSEGTSSGAAKGVAGKETSEKASSGTGNGTPQEASSGTGAGETPPPSDDDGPRAADVLDLGAASREAVLKRAVPILAGAAAVVLILLRLRRR